MEIQFSEWKKGFIPLSILFLLVLVFRVAWVTEDAFISFRAIEHLIQGRGFVYNVGERVQVFTDPLYCLILAPLAFFTNGEYFYSCIFLSLTFTLATGFLVGFKLNANPLVGACSVLILSFSIAFTEFSTAGLENALSHLLLALFYAEFLSGTQKRPFILALFASLAATNRLDSLVFYLPALASFFFQNPKKATVFKFLAGFSPLICWEVFSLVYYGFLFPNTAYAKLNLGVSGSELMEQGFIYLTATITHDPVTGLMLGLLLVSMILLFNRPFQLDGWAIWVGIILKLGIVVGVGGDYMLGRFLTEASLGSVMLFAWLASERQWQGAAHGLLFVLALGLALSSRHSPLKSDLSYGAESSDTRFEWNVEGLVDERSFYYPQLGLANRGRFGKVRIGSTNQALALGINHELGESPVSVMGNAGVLGFYADPSLHLVDVHALCDPLLARLPLANDFYWRTGHYPRNLPEGYVETIKTGTSKLKDSSLAEYYTHLKEVIGGPIFSVHRLKTILAINLGKYDHLIENYLNRNQEVTYRHFTKKEGKYRYPIQRLQTPLAPGTDVQDVRVLKFWDHAGSVFLEIGNPSHVRAWSALIANTGKTALRFYRNNQSLGTSQAIPTGPNTAGLQAFQILVPKQAWKMGYDAIEIVPFGGDNRCATSSWSAGSDSVNLSTDLFFKSAFCSVGEGGLVMQPADVYGIYGPYLPLPANSYKLRLELDREPVAGFKIGVNVYGSSDNVTFADQSFDNPGNWIEVPFTLEAPSPKLEFRILYQSNLPIPLNVKSIRLVVNP